MKMGCQNARLFLREALVEACVVRQEKVDLPRGAWTGTHRVGVSWRGKRLFSISQGPYRSYLFPVFTRRDFPLPLRVRQITLITTPSGEHPTAYAVGFPIATASPKKGRTTST